MRIYYFGCWDTAGHYLFESQYNRPSMDVIPWENIDGGLCTEETRIQGVAKIHHKDGWTALAFWDYSIDDRPGSNSVFLAEGIHGFYHMIEFSKKHFPKIFNRFQFKLVEFISPEEGA